MAKQGLMIPGDVSAETIYPIDTFTREVFFQEAPLFTGLGRSMVGADQFKMGINKVRAKTGLTLGAAVADSSTTSVTVSDGSIFMIGDVFQMATGERCEVTADPSGNVLTVRRGVEGTTAASQTISTAVVLLYNSRTGAEIDQTGNRSAPSQITQYVQTFQYPVQVGGKAAAMNAIQLAGSGGNLVASVREQKLAEMVRDAESAILEGYGDDGSTGNRKKMKGIRKIISEGYSANLTTAPTNASSYGPTDLHRDLFQKVLDAGGRPDTLLVSSGFAAAFVKWGWAKLLQSPTDASIGVNAQQMYVPLLGYPIAIVVDMMLRGITAACLSTTDGLANERVRLRYIRQESWSPRGNRGDAVEGEWLGDFALEVDDPSHQAWVEAITAFAAP